VTRNVSVYGTDHLHVVDLTTKLRDAGAHVRAVVATEDKIGPWLASQFPEARTDDPFGNDIDLVVSAAIPSERAQLAIDAMEAGKDVVMDKPGAVAIEHVDALEDAAKRTGRHFTIIFAERLGSAAMMRAYAMARDGAVGDVLHTVGLGPHKLSLDHRPEWFFDPARYGGILVDIGSHQVDQFLAFTGSHDADVVGATVRAHPEHPGLQVLGEMLLSSATATGYARVDYFTPAALKGWGEVRFTVVGTEGFLEVRVLDETVRIVDGTRDETFAGAEERVTWPDEVLRGISSAAMEHACAVSRICLRVQAAARMEDSSSG